MSPGDRRIDNTGMASKLALAIRHVDFEDCGTLAEVLHARGFALRYVDVYRHDLTAVDSYEWGGCVLAFQCHPEARGADIESWLVGHAVEIAATPAADVSQLRADRARLGPALARCARTAFGRWLSSHGL